MGKSMEKVPEQGLITECQNYLEKNYVPADLYNGGILVVAPELEGYH